MRNLDLSNPGNLRPDKLVPISLILPLLLSLVSIALATGAAPTTSFYTNPIALACTLVFVASLIFIFVPKTLNWNWRTRYFGVCSFCLGSASMLGGIPWLCILIYSAAPLPTRIFLFAAYLSTMIWWGSRFAKIYAIIFADKELREKIYRKDDDCFYYLQQGDKSVLEKLHFKQLPSSKFTFATTLLAVCTIFFMRPLVSYFELPFIHIFLAIFSIPIDMMAIGFAIRGWLTFYKYPAMIEHTTGKYTYVDIMTEIAKDTAPKERFQ